MRLEFSEDHKFPPVGRCIYCGSTDQLSNEHIIPYALGGYHSVLPESSCEACRRETGSFEAKCTKDNARMFYALRVALGINSRTGSTDVDQIPVFVIGPDGKRRKVYFSVDDMPPIGIFQYNVPPPGILEGRDPSDVPDRHMILRMFGSPGGPGESFKKTRGFVEVARFNQVAFLRMVAKIGYAYAAAAEPECREFLLPEVAGIIRGTHDSYLHYIGGGRVFDDQDSIPPSLHTMATGERVIGDATYTIALVWLFAQLNFPPLHVVVAKRPND
jgi:HNH endonuclease